jgi:flagellar FliL protein
MSAPAKPEAAAEAEAPAGKKGGGSMMPILAAVVLVPGLCFATTQYVLIPKLKADVAEQGVQPAPTAEKGKASKEKKEEHDTEFGAVIVNVAGANGSRYLRTNLVLVSTDPKVGEVTKASQSALKDAAINVLSSQPLSVLDSPGGKNVVRNELIAAFNKALGGEVIENIYFSEFVVQ